MNIIFKGEILEQDDLIKKVRIFCDFYKNIFSIELDNLEINLYKSRDLFEKERGRKTEDWEVGYTKNDKIYIISKESFSKESSHDESEFFPILKHEIGHIFYYKKFQTSFPMWLNEGICTYYATPKTKKLFKKDLINLSIESIHDFNDFNKIDSSIRYELVFLIIYEIIVTFGEDKLKEFLNNMTDPKNRNLVNVDFRKIFLIDADNFFNNIKDKLL